MLRSQQDCTVSMIYSLFIFDRHCNCIYFQDWYRRLQTSASGGVTSSQPLSPSATVQPQASRTSILSTLSSTTSLFSPSHHPNTENSASSNPGNALPLEEEAKLVYGVTFSLRNLVSKIAKPSPQPSAYASGNYFAYRTSAYKLHHMMTPSCLRFVLLTDPEAGDCKEVLQNIYARCYVEYVVKNPLARPGTDWMGEDVGEPGPIGDEYVVSNEYFRSVVNKYIRSLPLYAS